MLELRTVTCDGTRGIGPSLSALQILHWSRSFNPRFHREKQERRRRRRVGRTPVDGYRRRDTQIRRISVRFEGRVVAFLFAKFGGTYVTLTDM